MKTLTNLHKEILINCADDYTGLWIIIAIVEDTNPHLDANDKKQRVLQVLKELLDENLIQAGFPDDREFNQDVFRFGDPEPN
jgi:hypothetical protein